MSSEKHARHSQEPRPHTVAQTLYGHVVLPLGRGCTRDLCQAGNGYCVSNPIAWEVALSSAWRWQISPPALQDSEMEMKVSFCKQRRPRRLKVKVAVAGNYSPFVESAPFELGTVSNLIHQSWALVAPLAASVGNKSGPEGSQHLCHQSEHDQSKKCSPDEVCLGVFGWRLQVSSDNPQLNKCCWLTNVHVDARGHIVKVKSLVHPTLSLVLVSDRFAEKVLQVRRGPKGKVWANQATLDPNSMNVLLNVLQLLSQVEVEQGAVMHAVPNQSGLTYMSGQQEFKDSYLWFSDYRVDPCCADGGSEQGGLW